MEAPHTDGKQHLFEIKYRIAAFWDEEMKRWVLTRPLNLEYLPARATYIGPGPALSNGECK